MLMLHFGGSSSGSLISYSGCMGMQRYFLLFINNSLEEISSWNSCWPIFNFTGDGQQGTKSEEDELKQPEGTCT